MNLSERQSRVIRGGGAWQPLQISKLRGDCVGFGQSDPEAAAEAEVEARLAAAFQQGFAEGRARADAELQERERQQGLSAQQRWTGLLDGLAHGVHEIETQAADRLLDLAALLAASIACRDIALAADRITPVLDASLKLIGSATRQLEVSAHPSDCALIDAWLRQRCGETTLTIRPDSRVAPGGCLLRADDATLDATLQTRIRRSLASVGIDGAQAAAVVHQALAAAEDALSAAPALGDGDADVIDVTDGGLAT